MSERFDIGATTIKGLQLLQRKRIGDSRGWLERLFCADELRDATHGEGIVQINRTLTTKRGAVRGMHFQQPPYAETKFVSCLRGEVFDVAVDLRHNSPTFLRWHAEILSDVNQRTLVIPVGLAHGFQTLTEDCELLYFHTATYYPDAEGGLNAQDPRLAIQWPLPFSEQSARDRALPLLSVDYAGVAL